MRLHKIAWVERLTGRSRRAVFVATAAVLVALAAWWLWPRPHAVMPDPTWERVQRERVLRIGIDPTYPPFENDDGKGIVAGLDVDLARALAERLGVRAEFVFIHFDGLYDALRSERVDVLISALPYDGRQTKDVLYSPPYFNSGQTMVVRADDGSVTRAADLAGKRLAVEWGSSGDLEARRLQREQQIRVTIQPYETAGSALEALERGVADVALVDAVAALAAAGDEKRHLRTIWPALTDEPYIMATRRTSPVLWDTINKTLAGLQADGSLAQIVDRWF